MARFDLVLAVSETDRQTLERLYADHLTSPIYVVATGVDTEYFAPSSAPLKPRHMVFTGSMDWLPNEDAMVYFCREILPRIRQQEPSATLSIVGRAPTAAVRQLADTVPGVAVTGRVDDVRPYVAEGAVYIVPLRVGGGTRLKIFEAMSMAKAVVSTTVGAEGLPVTDGVDIVLADDPGRFASAVVRLMRDDARRERLQRAARQIVIERYDWAAVAEHLEAALVAAAGAHPAGAAGSRTADEHSPAAAARVTETIGAVDL
jgi:glycosyltransferase involved in cell wall biosynthesis